MVNSRGLRVLLPVETVAPWGGLQDWTVGVTKGLAAQGVHVTLMSNNERVLLESGLPNSQLLRVDWDRWQSVLQADPLNGHWDVVFAQPFRARQFALELRRDTGIPVVFMAHGNNVDHAYLWESEVAQIGVASASLVPQFEAICGVDRARISVLPVGVPDDFFSVPPRSFQQKISVDGSAQFVIASRLAADKVKQIWGIEQLVDAALATKVVREAEIVVYGGGPSQRVFEERLQQFAASRPEVRLSFRGWQALETIRHGIRDALFTVGGGVTGTQSVSLGTACFGVGRGISAISTPSNVDLVLGTNFGDHSDPFDFSPSQFRSDVSWLLADQNYDEFQRYYVPQMLETRSFSAVTAQISRVLASAASSASTKVHDASGGLAR